MIHDFLPICRADMDKRGWESCDFVYVCGDAYVDHPSFGHAIISRILEAHGYKVAGLEESEIHSDSGRTASRMACERRKYGLYGKPLFGFEKAPRKGFLHTGRRDGKTSGLCDDRLF